MSEHNYDTMTPQELLEYDEDVEKMEELEEWEYEAIERSANKKSYENYFCEKCRTESAFRLDTENSKCLNPHCNNTNILTKKVIISKEGGI